MEHLLETIALDSEENNELLFKIKIEGADPAPAKVRLVCETGDVSFMFNGQPIGDDVVAFNLPIMKDKIKEGIYLSSVEVLVENRYFTPVQFQINFKKTVKVVAESIKLMPRKVPQEIKISAVPIPTVKQPEPIQVVQQPVVKEAKQEQQIVRQTLPISRDSQKTLREKFYEKSEVKLLSEDEILDAAKNFVKTRKKK
jgi:hypothetical protein